MNISKEDLFNVIIALHKGNYTITDLATDYSGCYSYITLPDGEKGHLPVYDDATYGTTPPVQRKLINVNDIKIFLADSGIDYYEPDIMLVDEEPAYDDSWESTDGSCNIEVADEDSFCISDEQENLLDDIIMEYDIDTDTGSPDFVEILISIIRTVFCTDDTWDDVPDDCLDDEAVDIEDCTLIQNVGLGSIDIKGTRYYIVDTDPELNDDAEQIIDESKDNEPTFVYAVPASCTPNEQGIYCKVYLIGYIGSLDTPKLVYAKEDRYLSYNSVDVIVE